MPLQFNSYQELFDRGIDVRAAWCEKCRKHEAHVYDKPANRLTCVVCDTVQVFDDIEILEARQQFPANTLKWEVVSDEDDVMHHVRWSKPNRRGEFFMCAHYPDKWRAQSQADEWNRVGKSPFEFDLYALTEH